MTDIVFLGVVNATPNSFSDGHKNLDIDFQKTQLDKFYEKGFVLDIGAESTAPFNCAIDYEQEWRRLKDYVSTHLKRLKTFKTISIDTYKASTMESFLQEFGGYFDNIIWNDISGIIDDEMIMLLEKYPNLRYVLCHNLAPKRSLANSHMDYLDHNLNQNSVKDFFLDRIALYTEAGLNIERLILDPCFGFSKTRDQNLKLLETIHEIKEIHPYWLIGISKKSFLQHLVTSTTNIDFKQNIHSASEQFHWRYLKELKSRFNGVKQLYFRVHEAGNITD